MEFRPEICRTIGFEKIKVKSNILGFFIECWISQFFMILIYRGVDLTQYATDPAYGHTKHYFTQ